MASNTRSQLEQAYRLIQEERLDEAIALLRPVLSSEPNNGDAWWLMANAVSEPQDAYDALQNVLRINPNHAEARELVNTLTQEFPYLAQAAPAAHSDFGESDASFDDLFGSTPAPAPTASASNDAFSSADLDALLGGKSSPAPSYGSYDSADDFGDVGNADDLFGSSSSSYSSSTSGDDAFGSYDDPFAASAPAFAQDDIFEEQPGGKADKKRGRAEPRPRREKAPKPRRLAKEEAAPDPFAAERRANSRPSPFRVILLVLVLGLLIGAGVLGAYMTGLIGRPAVPDLSTDDSLFGVPTDNINGAVQAIGARFRKEPFREAVAVLTNSGSNTLEIKFCDFSGPSLIKHVNRALDLAAQGAAPLRNNLQNVTLTVVNCTNPSAILYRTTAPITAITAYYDGGMADKKTYRASWVPG